MKHILILIFLVFSINYSFAQNKRIETERFIYWQTGVKLHFEDYQKEIDSSAMIIMDRHGENLLSNIQIHAILDYSKKPRKIKKLKEQWYIAPVFCKKCSPIKEKDSLELLHENLYYDIAEYCSHRTRKMIAELEEKDMRYGFIASMFPGLINNMYNYMGEMFSSSGTEILIDKRPGAYEDWRKTVDELLEMTKEYATKSIDCKRFINDKPFSDEYKVSYEIYGRNL